MTHPHGDCRASLEPLLHEGIHDRRAWRKQTFPEDLSRRSVADVAQAKLAPHRRPCPRSEPYAGRRMLAASLERGPVGFGKLFISSGPTIVAGARHPSEIPAPAPP